MKHSSRSAVIAGLVGDVLIAITKGIAAVLSGSSAMLSEAVHSAADSTTEALLLYGEHRAKKPPDEAHPMGYGRELYFWSFVVSLIIFALGAGVAFYEGVSHIMSPEPIERPGINYAVYGCAGLLELMSWFFAWKAFQPKMGNRGILATIQASKDPPLFMTMFVSSAGVAGIAIAALATFLAVSFAVPWIDGIGSICIALLLAAGAILLASETKGLLVGEPASKELRDALNSLPHLDSRVQNVKALLTSQLGPNQVIANVGVEFRDDMRTPEIEQLIEDIERRLQTDYPQLVKVFIRPHPNPDSFDERQAV
jgi:cation diffusion facilitator family transporter